jgi:nucleotide-binding universal stress UspA family protein
MTAADATRTPTAADPGQSPQPAPYKVLAACDFTPLGNRVVIEAIRHCEARAGAELHVVSVAAEHARGLLLPGQAAEVMSNIEAQEFARQHVALLLDDYLAQGQRISLEHVAVYVVGGNPSERIVGLASGLDADLIVLGTHSRHGLERVLLGSVAQEVLRRATCGVFVIRPRDFLDGEKVPEIQPPLQPQEHALLPVHLPPTYYHVPRGSREQDRIMPVI